MLKREKFLIPIDNLKTVSLNSLLKAENEPEALKRFLSTFKCEKNMDVQNYLHYMAIESEKRSFSRTTLVINHDHQIVGYFTLLIKDFVFIDVSKTIRKQLTGSKNATSFITILIAQLGRSDLYKDKIKGELILNLALEKCQAINNLSALRVVCVEHDDNENLNKFYEENDFKKLQTNINKKVMRFVRL